MNKHNQRQKVQMLKIHGKLSILWSLWRMRTPAYLINSWNLRSCFMQLLTFWRYVLNRHIYATIWFYPFCGISIYSINGLGQFFCEVSDELLLFSVFLQVMVPEYIIREIHSTRIFCRPGEEIHSSISIRNYLSSAFQPNDWPTLMFLSNLSAKR